MRETLIQLTHKIMAAKKVQSLSEQMAELSNAAPRDDEVESDVDAYDAVQVGGGEGSEDDAEEEARNHARHSYITPASSRMRKQADHLDGADEEQRRKYEGVKATRSEMMSDEESGSEIGSVSSSGSDSDNVYDEVGQDDDEGSRRPDGGEGRREGPKRKLEEGTSSRRKDVRFAARPARTDDNPLTAAESDTRLLQSLRERNKEDAAKGRDVRRQRDSWGKLLGTRIRSQKLVRTAGRIPSQMAKQSIAQLDEVDREAYDSTLESLDQISRHLFVLQQHLLASFANRETREGNLLSAMLPVVNEEIDQVVANPLKRSSTDADYHDQQVDTLFKLDQGIFEPLWRDVLARWSSRTSTSTSQSMSRNRFHSTLRAMDQSAEDQIDRGLSGDAFDRLRKRTRVWRGTDREARLTSNSGRQDDQDGGEDDEGGKAVESADIFDDSDFYAALLRELIDSRGASSEIGVDVPDSSLAWAQAAKRAAKKNTSADTKGSKGRKLRYDVIEKVEHFMPPVPRETWTRDQIDRLFRQLKDQERSARETEPEEEIPEGEKVELAGLRLFG